MAKTYAIYQSGGKRIRRARKAEVDLSALGPSFATSLRVGTAARALYLDTGLRKTWRITAGFISSNNVEPFGAPFFGKNN